MSDERHAKGGLSFRACLRCERVQLGLLFLFALAVHVPKLGVSVGSPDEEGSPDNLGAIQICQESVTRITTNFYKARNHPLFSILGHLAVKSVPVSTLIAARLPALVAGLLVPPVFYFSHRAWVGRQAAMVVALLLLVTDPLHHYVTAARGYSMLVLGSLLMNQLLLGYLRRRRPGVLAAYGLVAVATTYTHLWGFLILVAHAVYLGARCSGAVLWKTRGERAPVGFWIGGMSVILGAVGLTLLLYRPMLADVLAMAGARNASRLDAVRVLGDNLLQLGRFRDWTLAVYVMLVPIVLEGFARRLRGSRLDEVCWFHVTVIACASGTTLVAPPQNFDSRFLMPLIPSAASLVAWGLSGYWCTRGEGGERVLPRTATWLAGFALGVVVSNASMTVDIPASAMAVHTDDRGVDHGYFYRNLPKAVGSRAGWCLLGIATALILARRRVISWPGRARGRGELLGIGLCSGLLLLSLAALALGPGYTHYVLGLPRWVFEVHLPATTLIWLLAWEHRFDTQALRGLRYGLLLTLLVVVVWQLGGDRVEWDAWAPVRLMAIVPPVLVSVAVAREGEWAGGQAGH